LDGGCTGSCGVRYVTYYDQCGQTGSGTRGDSNCISGCVPPCSNHWIYIHTDVLSNEGCAAACWSEIFAYCSCAQWTAAWVGDDRQNNCACLCNK
jgi:hypothetical protein